MLEDATDNNGSRLCKTNARNDGLRLSSAKRSASWSIADSLRVHHSRDAIGHFVAPMTHQVDLDTQLHWSSNEMAATSHDAVRAFDQSKLTENRAMSSKSTTYDGGCLCGFVRYRMTTSPLIVHCCHCRSCQRQTGSAFALNALIEPDRVQLLAGEVQVVDAPSETGKGQKISQCPRCHAAVWSKHTESAVWFVHVGTLDEPDRLPPDIHLFTASKQPWLLLPPGTRASAEFYNPTEVWPKESLQRRAEMLARLQQQ